MVDFGHNLNFRRQVNFLNKARISTIGFAKKCQNSNIAKKFIMGRNLGVLDFDHTLVDDNSDTAVFNLVKNKVPDEIRQLELHEGWTSFMQGMLKHMQEKGVKEEQIKTVVQNLSAVSGMLDLVKKLKELNYDLIIISDANSYFIETWLESNGLSQYISRVFTNPCEVVNGMFKINPYHIQESCKLSTRNMCKGQIMEDFIKSQESGGVRYTKVVYVGDGVNDFCPVLRLGPTDLACARRNYKLIELINKGKKGVSLDHTGKVHKVQAEVFVWDTGEDIFKRLTQ